jgi:GntR family transcriptional regulator
MAGDDARRVADALRAEIENGTLPAGSKLPSGDKIAERFGIHRGTALKAVRQLATEGYVTVARRQAAVVRNRPRHLTVVRDRNVYRDALGYYFDRNAQDWRAVEPPTRGLAVPPNHVADLLKVPRGHDVLVRERLMGPPADPPQALQISTSYLPMSLVAEIPALGAEATGPGGIYDRLEEYFDSPLDWPETIGSRLPTEEEQATLGVAPTIPLLVVTRVTLARRDGEKFVAEVNETRMPADQFAVSYTVQRDASAAWPRGTA